MNIPLFPLLSLAGLLIGLSMANTKVVKAALSNIIEWCGDSDYMNVIALGLAVSAVVLINWGMYWV